MAAGRMEMDGTSRAVLSGKKSSVSQAKSVSPVKLRKCGAPPRSANKKFRRARALSSEFCYADLSHCRFGCNNDELSAESEPYQTLVVSSLKQQLRASAEVFLQASAPHSELNPATLPRKGRATAAAPQVTESRRVRRHPAGRQGRHHESRAPRRAGSQG